jgi:hypothetical protein
MSEGVAHGADVPALGRSQPAYGEGRIRFEAPPKAEESIDRGAEIALASAIFVPVIAVYAAAAYGVYRAVSTVI